MEHAAVERKTIQLDDEDGGGGGSAQTPSPSLCQFQCRICHEEEEAESTAMEAPCACSGTLKFAHRGCIQRWCDEKRSTVCEICLQKFRPGYTFPPEVSQLLDVMVTIRGSLEIPRLEYDPHRADDAESDYDDQLECSLSDDNRSGSTSCCRSVALTVAILLLVWHLTVVIMRADHYPFALTTVLLLRASGILLPFYLVMHMIATIQRTQRRQRRRRLHLQRTQQGDGPIDHEEEDFGMHQHSIQIHS